MATTKAPAKKATAKKPVKAVKAAPSVGTKRGKPGDKDDGKGGADIVRQAPGNK